MSLSELFDDFTALAKERLEGAEKFHSAVLDLAVAERDSEPQHRIERLLKACKRVLPINENDTGVGRENWYYAEDHLAPYDDFAEGIWNAAELAFPARSGELPIRGKQILYEKAAAVAESPLAIAGREFPSAHEAALEMHTTKYFSGLAPFPFGFDINEYVPRTHLQGLPQLSDELGAIRVALEAESARLKRELPAAGRAASEVVIITTLAPPVLPALPAPAQTDAPEPPKAGTLAADLLPILQKHKSTGRRRKARELAQELELIGTRVTDESTVRKHGITVLRSLKWKITTVSGQVPGKSGYLLE